MHVGSLGVDELRQLVVGHHEQLEQQLAVVLVLPGRRGGCGLCRALSCPWLGPRELLVLLQRLEQLVLGAPAGLAHGALHARERGREDDAGLIAHVLGQPHDGALLLRLRGLGVNR